MIVVDANVVMYFVFESAQTEKAIRARAMDRDWIAPPLIEAEVYSVLVKRLRRGDITRDSAMKAFKRAQTLFRVVPSLDLAQRFGLAMDFENSPYDLEYVALAIERKVRLVTADKEVLRNFPDTAISLEGILR